MSLLELEPAVEVESKVELLSEEEYGEYVRISIERSNLNSLSNEYKSNTSSKSILGLNKWVGLLLSWNM